MKRQWASLGVVTLLLAGCGQVSVGGAAGEANSASPTTPQSGDTLKQVAQTLGTGMKKIKQGIEEAELAGKVYARISWDKQLQTVKLSIDAKPGAVVEISGVAPDQKSKSRVLDLVANTSGVKEVIDRIKVEGAVSVPAVTEKKPAPANPPEVDKPIFGGRESGRVR